jgi:chromosome partitioning protein
VKTIVVANQKGGSGKSTSTVHLAVAAEQAGDGPVLISDTDPQGSTGDWFNQRKRSGIDTPRYAPLALSDLSNKLARFDRRWGILSLYRHGPSIGSVNAELFAIADLILRLCAPRKLNIGNILIILPDRNWPPATGRFAAEAATACSITMTGQQETRHPHISGHYG